MTRKTSLIPYVVLFTLVIATEASWFNRTEFSHCTRAKSAIDMDLLHRALPKSECRMELKSSTGQNHPDASTTRVIDINSCESIPCLNGATCQDYLNKYQCSCHSGFTGFNCETDINECESIPCLNGATCQDYLKEYHCTCLPGLSGFNCEIDINECESHSCLNGATCVDRVNEYVCWCFSGFIGVNCQTDINECESHLCLNGATCLDRVNEYMCWCFPGFIGVNCQTDSSIAFILKSMSIFAASLDPNTSLLDASYIRLPIDVIRPISLAYDPQDRMVYWIEKTTISRATLNGSTAEVLANVTDLTYFGEITLELQDRKIYWTNFSGASIERASFDGSKRKVVIDNVTYPLGIAVDPVNRKLFWKEQFKVMRSDLDGNDFVQIASGYGSAASPIFYYPEESRLLFTDYKYHMVQSVRSDGSEQHLAFSWNASRIDHITVHNSVMYFSTSSGEFGEVPLDNLTAVRTVDTLRGLNTSYEYKTKLKNIHVYNIN